MVCQYFEFIYLAEDVTVPKYIGLVRTPHFSTPRRAKACFLLAKEKLLAKNRTIKTMGQQIQRLRHKNAELKELCNHLKKKFDLTDLSKNQLMVG